MLEVYVIQNSMHLNHRNLCHAFSSRSEALSPLILPDLPPKIITEISGCDTTVNLGGNSLDPVEDISDAVFGDILKKISDFLANANYRTMSPRQTEFAHLIETERNYVTILLNIVKVNYNYFDLALAFKTVKNSVF